MSRALEAAAGEVEAGREDETRVIGTQRGSPAQRPSSGYVPPAAPPPAPAREPSVARRPPSTARRRPANRVMSSIATLAVLAAAALVVVLVVVPLLGSGGGGGAGTPTGSPSVAPSVATDVIPDTVGMATEDAIALARQAGLDWTVRCAEDASRPEGIIDQEPPAGTRVTPGSPFTMYSARFSDCS